MTTEEYTRVLGHAHGVRLQARQLADDLDEAIAMVDRADSVGPILDPTLYRERSEALQQDREVLVALRGLGRLGAS